MAAYAHTFKFVNFFAKPKVCSKGPYTRLFDISFSLSSLHDLQINDLRIPFFSFSGMESYKTNKHFCIVSAIRMSEWFTSNP